MLEKFRPLLPGRAVISEQTEATWQEIIDRQAQETSFNLGANRNSTGFISEITARWRYRSELERLVTAAVQYPSLVQGVIEVLRLELAETLPPSRRNMVVETVGGVIEKTTLLPFQRRALDLLLEELRQRSDAREVIVILNQIAKRDEGVLGGIARAAILKNWEKVEKFIQISDRKYRALLSEQTPKT